VKALLHATGVLCVSTAPGFGLPAEDGFLRMRSWRRSTAPAGIYDKMAAFTAQHLS
jgi:hypothetical protein